MRPWSIAALLLVAVNANGQSSASTIWEDLKAKRGALPGLHQEFEVTRAYQTARATQSSKVEVVVDISANKWRERFVSGAMVIASDGTLTSVADGDKGFGELRKFLKKAGMDTE